MTLRGAVVAAFALAALTACAASPGSNTASSPAASPTPSVAMNQRYVSLVNLRDAAVMAGYPCPHWTQDDEVTNASESGACSDGDVFSLYDSDASLQAQAETYRDFEKQFPDGDSKTLVGSNWIINVQSKDFDSLKEKLGGTDVSDMPASQTSESSDTTATFDGKATDFRVGIKIRKKQCFGSAGCNVTYQIVPSYVGLEPLPDKGVIEVTYEVTGDESGKITNTFTVDSQGTAHFDKEEDASTKAASVKLKAKTTDVSYDPDATE